MKFHKLAKSVCAAVLACGMLAGCGGGTDASTETSSGSQEAKIVLNYWTWESGIEPVIEAFNKEYPNIEIKITKVASSGDYLTKIQQSVASGAELPDILLGEVGIRGLLFEMNIWEDFESSSLGLDRSLFFESSVERSCLPDGTLAGMENSVNPAAMAYKRSVAEKYFDSVEREDMEAAFATFDDMLAQAARIHEESGGKDFLFTSSGMVMDWLYNANADPLVDENGVVQYTAKMKPVLDKLVALRDAEAIDNYANWTPQNNAAYAGDNHLFYPTANWAIVYLIKANDPEGVGDWGMMLPPGGGYAHGGTVLGVYNGSKNKEAAFTYLNWMLNTDNGVNTLKEEVAFYVPNKRYYEDESFTSLEDDFFPGQDIGELMYNEIVPELEVAPITPYDTAVVNTNSMIAQALMADRSMTADQALEKALEQLRTDLPDVTVE